MSELPTNAIADADQAKGLADESRARLGDAMRAGQLQAAAGHTSPPVDDEFHTAATEALGRRAKIVDAMQRGRDAGLDPIAESLLPTLRAHIDGARAALAAAKNDAARGRLTPAGLAEDTQKIEAQRNAAVDQAVNAAALALSEQAQLAEQQLREAYDVVTDDDRRQAADLSYEVGMLSLAETLPFVARCLTKAARDDSPGAAAAVLPFLRTLAAEHDDPNLAALVIRATELATPWQAIVCRARLARAQTMRHELSQVSRAARAGEFLPDMLEFRALDAAPDGPPLLSSKKGRRIGHAGAKRGRSSAQDLAAARRAAAEGDEE